MEDICFTVLCCFLPNLNMNQPQTYICPLPLELPSPLPPHPTPLGITGHRVELAWQRFNLRESLVLMSLQPTRTDGPLPGELATGAGRGHCPGAPWDSQATPSVPEHPSSPSRSGSLWMSPPPDLKYRTIIWQPRFYTLQIQFLGFYNVAALR